ncbi:hypothetical protein IC582_017330 [Cucumis melo]
MSNSLSDVSRLYKDLVSALLKSVSEASCGSLDDLEDKEECNEIAEGRAELVNVLKTVNFELHVQEPFFTQLKDGLKRVEGRCAAGNYNRYCKELSHYKIAFLVTVLETFELL